MEYQPMATNTPSDDMVRGYLDCAEWCGLEDADREALELSVLPKWSAETIHNAESICADFLESVGLPSDRIDDEYRAGMDLWLTSNRHGAGFWDGDWPEPFATEATTWCHVQGEAYVTFDAESETLEIS